MPNPVPQSKLEVINQTLLALGQDELQSISALSGTSKAARIMRVQYEPIADACLTKTSWRFATAKAALNKYSGVPTNRWAAAWNLPADLLLLITTWPISNYERQGQRILTNEQTRLEIDYIRKVEEAYWPAWFTRYVVAMLAWRCCKGVTGDEPTADMKAELDAAQVEALFQDSRQQPNQAIMANDFIDCRN